MEYKDLGRYIPIIFLLSSWGSLFGVPNKVPVFSAPKGIPEDWPAVRQPFGVGV